MYIRFAARGLFAWAVATLILRALPASVTHHSSSVLLISAAVSGALLIPATLWLTRKQVPAEKPMAAAAFVAPQLVGDAITTAAFIHVLPNFPPDHAGPFGALVLWCYGVMLATAVIAGRRGA